MGSIDDDEEEWLPPMQSMADFIAVGGLSIVAKDNADRCNVEACAYQQYCRQS